MGQPTASVEQAASDCVGGNNYPNAVLPNLTQWDGKAPPAPAAGQIYLDVADWRPNGIGRHVAVLVDPATGTFPWSAVVNDQNLAQFRGMLVGGMSIGNCCLPPCPPTECGQWQRDTMMARTLQEHALRAVPLPEQSWFAAQLPGK